MSIKSVLSSLRHKGQITNDQYKQLITAVSNIETNRLQSSDIVRNYLYEVLTPVAKNSYTYLYQILNIAHNVDTNEKMVVFQELYGDFNIYVMSYKNFMAEVDHNKYPNIEQKYVFEKVVKEVI